MRSLLVFMAGALLLAGCASHNPEDDINTFFATYISKDGSKRFVFNIETMRGGGPGEHGMGGDGPSGGPPGGMGGGRGGPQHGSRQSSHQQGPSEKVITDLLTQKLKTTGYCQQGYMTLDDTQAGRFRRITGECNETATAADRKKFPNVGNGRIEDLGR